MPVAATAKSSVRVQRGDSASTIASAIAPTATMSSAIPTPSTRRRTVAGADSGSRYAAPHSENAPIGRLMKNAHGQPTVSITKDPRLGPTAAAKPPTAPHRLTVSARLCCGNAAMTIDSDAGVSNAAPTACSTRAAISHATLPASPQAADAAMNNATPTRNTRLRPCVSARPPAGMSIAA